MPLMIVATLKVKRGELEAFRRFESIAARAMRRHRGSLERAVFVDEGAEDWVREVHLLCFESEQAFEGYRKDPELALNAALRERSVLETQVMMGELIDYAGL